MNKLIPLFALLLTVTPANASVLEKVGHAVSVTGHFVVRQAVKKPLNIGLVGIYETAKAVTHTVDYATDQIFGAE